MESIQQMTFDEIKPFDGVFDDLNQEMLAHFLIFHEKNPSIFKLFRKYAETVRARGANNYGAKALMERIRWEVEIERNEEFKINNNYVSFYVRLLIFLEPSFKDFFEMRSSCGKGEVSTH